MTDELATILQHLDPVPDIDTLVLSQADEHARQIHQRALEGDAGTPPSRRRATPLVAVGLLVLAGLGAWASPFGETPDCSDGSSIQDQVVVQQLEDGTRYVLWTTRFGPDEPVNGTLLVRTPPSGFGGSTSGECGPAAPSDDGGNPLATVRLGGGTVDDGARRATSDAYGAAPVGAETVEVTYDDGVVVLADVSVANYWLVVRTLDDIDPADVVLPQPVRLVALDADGGIIDVHEVASS